MSEGGPVSTPGSKTLSSSTPIAQKALGTSQATGGEKSRPLGLSSLATLAENSTSSGRPGAGAAPALPLPCTVSFTLKCWEENLQLLPRIQPEGAMLKITAVYWGM